MRPVAPRTGAPEVAVAENQPEYLAITAAVYPTDVGGYAFLTRWRLSPEERQRVLEGEDLYLMQITRGQMTPIQLVVGCPEEWKR